MARGNFEACLSRVLKHEGGFVNHPSDPGGATNKGITIAVFRKFVKRNGTVEDLKRITDADVAKVYRAQYWNKVRGDDLPAGVDYAVFDFAVNSGPVRSAKFLQAILGVPEDGVIGPVTVTASMRRSRREVINALCDRRLDFLQRLSTFSTFGRGWTSRVAGVRSDALAMAAAEPVQPQKPVPAPSPQPAPEKPASGFRWLVLIIFLAVVALAAFFIFGFRF